MGYMLQQDYLFPWKTIEENIMLGLHIRRIYDEQMKEHTLNLLKASRSTWGRKTISS